MNFSTTRPAFLEALDACSRLAGRKTPFHTTSHVLLTALQGGLLEICATDLESSLRIELDADIEAGGKALLPASILRDIVKLGSQDAFRLNDLQSSWTRVASGNASWDIPGLDPEDFPTLPDISTDTAGFSLEGWALCDLVEKALSASPGESKRRPHLTGVLFQLFQKESPADPPHLRVVSTDGNRLAVTERPVTWKGSRSWEKSDFAASLVRSVIFPKKTLPDLARLAANQEEVDLALAGSHLVARVDRKVLFCRRIEGDYPDFRLILPDTDSFFYANRQALAGAFSRMRPLTSENCRGVSLFLSKNALKVAINNPETGSASETLAVTYDGPLQDWAFNLRYLLDALAGLSGNEAEISFRRGPANSGIVIRSTTDTGHRLIVMPMLNHSPAFSAPPDPPKEEPSQEQAPEVELRLTEQDAPLGEQLKKARDKAMTKKTSRKKKETP